MVQTDRLEVYQIAHDKVGSVAGERAARLWCSEGTSWSRTLVKQHWSNQIQIQKKIKMTSAFRYIQNQFYMYL